MTTDTGPLPSHHALEKAVQAVQRAAREQAHLRLVLVVAIVLVAAGTLVAVAGSIALSIEPGLDWIRNWKGFFHQFGVSGVVLMVAYLLWSRLKVVLARLDRIEARQEVCQPPQSRTRSRRRHINRGEDQQQQQQQQQQQERSAEPPTDGPPTVVAMPNPRVYQLGIEEGLRRAKRPRDGRPSN